MTTLATIGYGDIVPKNRYEKIYACIVMCPPAPHTTAQHRTARCTLEHHTVGSAQGERHGNLLDDYFESPRRVCRARPRGDPLQPVPPSPPRLLPIREYLRALACTLECSRAPPIHRAIAAPTPTACRPLRRLPFRVPRGGALCVSADGVTSSVQVSRGAERVHESPPHPERRVAAGAAAAAVQAGAVAVLARQSRAQVRHRAIPRTTAHAALRILRRTVSCASKRRTPLHSASRCERQKPGRTQGLYHRGG